MMYFKSHIQDVESVCGENEEFNTCGSYCVSTCATISKRCILSCKTGCFCKEGYVRESSNPNSPCVHKSECFQLRQLSQCGENETFEECGSACVETCNDKPEFCTQQCVAGCFCLSSNHVRANNSTGSPCIERNQCLKR